MSNSGQLKAVDDEGWKWTFIQSDVILLLNCMPLYF